MASVHRNGDSRACGATTIASNPDVYVNDELAAIDKNPNSHGAGGLNAANPGVYIGYKLVVVNKNSAAPDNSCPLPGGSHCSPSATGGSPDTHIGS